MGLIVIKSNRFDWGEDARFNQFYASPQQLWAATHLLLTDLSASMIAGVSDGNSNHYMNPQSIAGDSLIYLDDSKDRDLFMENNNQLGICAKRLDRNHFQITRREYESIIITIMATINSLLLSENKMQLNDSEEDQFIQAPRLLKEFLRAHFHLQPTVNEAKIIVLLGNGVDVQFLRPALADSSGFLLTDIANHNKTRRIEDGEFHQEVFGVASSLTPVRLADTDSVVYLTPSQIRELKDRQKKRGGAG